MLPTMQFEIEDGVPIPEKRTYKYPLSDLEVGQSIFVPNETHNRVRGHVESHKRRNGFDYVTRTVVENDIKGVRVWRTK